MHAFNVQTNHKTCLEQVQENSGGHRMRGNDPSLYNKILRVSALPRLGTERGWLGYFLARTWREW